MTKRAKGQASREDRLREALRENLKRRRAQARGRQQAEQNDKRRKTESEKQT